MVEEVSIEDDDLGEESDLIDIATVKRWYRDDHQHSADWREQAREDFAFVAGDQWNAEDMEVLRDQDRPVITFNRVDPVIDAVAGTEVNNRQQTRYIPRQVGASEVNEVLSDAAKWMRDECDAEDEESDAFRDMLICGVGATETRLDYTRDPQGKALIDRIDPMEILWDSTARKKNISDARRIMRVREIDIDDARAEFPGFDDGDLHASWAMDTKEDDTGIHVTVPVNEAYGPRSADETEAPERSMVRIVTVQWWKKEPYHRVVDPQTGQIAEMSVDDFALAEESATAMGIQLDSVRQVRCVYYQAFVGNVVLLAEPCPCPTDFTIKVMTAKRDRNTGTFYGLVRAMKDPQRWANKWLSQVLHIINSNAKGGLLAEQNAFINPRKAREEWADPNSITMLKDGGLLKIKEKSPITYPAGLDRLMEFAISSIRDVTGVNLEMLGQADREQAGILETVRQKTAVTLLAPLFDALRRYRKEQGRVLLYFIQNYLSDERLVRITGESGAQYVPLVRDPNVTAYDVIVDDAPNSPNQKQEAWAVIQSILPIVAGQMDAEMWAETLRYSPLPASLAQKYSNLIRQRAEQASQPNPQAQMMQQLQTEAVRAEVEKDRSTAALNLAKAGAADVGAWSQAVTAIGGYGPPPMIPPNGPQALQSTAAGVHDLSLAANRNPQFTAAAVERITQPRIIPPIPGGNT